MIGKIVDAVLESTPEEAKTYADELIARHVNAVEVEASQTATTQGLLLRRVARRAVYEALGLEASQTAAPDIDLTRSEQSSPSMKATQPITAKRKEV